MEPSVQLEKDRRESLWNQLSGAEITTQARRSVLNQLEIYLGGRGVWFDKEKTDGIGSTVGGVAVSVLHTGRYYANDLSEQDLLYHYPVTNRPGQDKSDVQSLKNAKQLGLWIFAILPGETNSTREVRRGYIQELDDASGTCLVSFGRDPPAPIRESESDLGDFQLTAPGSRQRVRIAQARPEQPRFKFLALRRYGARCAVCDVDIPETLDVAHIKPASEGGSYDPRNALILCALHHRELDSGLFLVNPQTLAVISGPRGESLEKLRVTRTDIRHLPAKPHQDALSWHWSNWKRLNAASEEQSDEVDG